MAWYVWRLWWQVGESTVAPAANEGSVWSVPGGTGSYPPPKPCMVDTGMQSPATWLFRWEPEGLLDLDPGPGGTKEESAVRAAMECLAGNRGSWVGPGTFYQPGGGWPYHGRLVGLPGGHEAAPAGEANRGYPPGYADFAVDNVLFGTPGRWRSSP